MLLLKQIKLSCANQFYRHCMKNRYGNFLLLSKTWQPIPSRLLSVTHLALSHPLVEQDISSRTHLNKSTFIRKESGMNQNKMVSIEFIRKKFGSLVHDGRLDGNSAVELLQMCGTPSGIGNWSKRNEIANKIFNATQNKTVELFNVLLSTYIKNNKLINSDDILKRMKKEDLKPNETTYATLIAGDCMRGDMNSANQIVQFLKQSEMEIPADVYGYFAYGMCIAGNPQYGFQILERILTSNQSISSNSFALLCRGVAASNNIKLFNASIDAFASKTDQNLYIYDVISIYNELQKHGQEDKIIKLLDCIVNDHFNIEHAIDCLSSHQTISTSPLLKNLLICYHKNTGKHLNNFVKLGALKVVLMPYFKEKESSAALWNEVMSIKPAFGQFNEAAYMALCVLLLEKSPHCKAFADQLAENKILVNLKTVMKMSVFKDLNKLKKEKVLKAWTNLGLPTSVPEEAKKNAYDILGDNTSVVQLKDHETGKRNPDFSKVVSSRYYYSERAYSLLSEFKQSSRANAPRILASLLKEVLSSSHFNPTTFVNDISEAHSDHIPTAEMIDSKLLLTSFALLLNHGLHGWQLGNLQKLLDELFARDFTIRKKEIDSLNQQLNKDNKCLSDFIMPGMHSSQSFCFSDRSQFKKDKSNHLTSLLEDLHSAKVQFHKKVPTDVICDIIIDGQYNLSVKSFNKLLKIIFKDFGNLPGNILTFIFCCHMQNGSFEQAQELLKKVLHKINLKVQTIPSTFLQDSNSQKVLLSYLKLKFGKKEADWILYHSLLKAGLTSQASQVFDKDSNYTISQEKLLALIFDLPANDDLNERYHDILSNCHDLQHRQFDQMQLCFFIVENFLAKGNFKAAKSFIEQNVTLNQNPSFIKTLQKLYTTYSAVVPFCLHHQAHKKLVNLITAENMSISEVLQAFQQVVAAGKFHYFYNMSPLFCLFYTKLPVDKYEEVCQQMADIYPRFKPHRQSKILIDRIQRLVGVSQFDKAISFALKFLVPSNEENISVWQSTIDTFGNVSLLHDKPNLLHKLQNSSLLEFPKSQHLVEAYLLYHDLKNGKSLDCERSVELTANLLTDVQDVDAFGKMFDVAISKCSMHPSVLTSAFASAMVKGYQIDRVSGMLETHDLKSELVVDVAAKSYTMVSTCEDLLRIDTYLRPLTENNIDLNVTLNDRLFCQFCKISMSSNYEEMTLQYLIRKYHQIPPHLNTALAKYIYQDLFTVFRYT